MWLGDAKPVNGSGTRSARFANKGQAVLHCTGLYAFFSVAGGSGTDLPGAMYLASTLRMALNLSTLGPHP